MNDLFAILSTVHRCPAVGSRCLIALPRPHSHPHAIGRIVTAIPYAGGAMPTFFLTIAIENSDKDAARSEFPRTQTIDCYPTIVEAEMWHAIGDAHMKKHGYARNHWL